MATKQQQTALLRPDGLTNNRERCLAYMRSIRPPAAQSLNQADRQRRRSYFSPLEKQHDFNKDKCGNISASIINHQNSDDFKRTEAEIVSIHGETNRESWAFCDSPSIQAILNIRTNSRLYWPGELGNGGAPWGRITRLAAATATATELDAVVNPPGLSPNGEDVAPYINLTTPPVQQKKGVWSRCYYQCDNDKGVRKIWKISSVVTVDYLGKKSSAERLPKGANILTALGIPNNSICVVDAQGSAGNFLTMLQQRNPTGRDFGAPGTQDLAMINNNTAQLYVYMDPVIQADPATKVNFTNKSLFNSTGNVMLRALVNRSEMTVRGDNGQLRMRYDIKHKMTGRKGGQKGRELNLGQFGAITQTWCHTGTTPAQPDGGALSVADRIKWYNLTVKDANKNNSIAQLGKKFRTYRTHQTGGGFNPRTEGLKRAAALNFQRKAGGDRFQGWTAKTIRNYTGNVQQYFWLKNVQNRWEAQTALRQFPSIINEEGDTFVVTQDIPFLVWCLKNNVNALFGSAGSAGSEYRKFVYFKCLN